MFGLDTLAGRRLQAELAQENRSGRVSNAIIVLEVLRDHHTGCIENVRPRVGDTEGWRILLDGVIQNTVGSDHLGLRIREQFESNVFAIGERLEDRDAIVADRHQTQALRADSRSILFQLDQLGFAERSPVRRTKENEQRTFRPHDRTKCLLVSVLILENKIGSSFADLGDGRRRTIQRQPR